MIGSWGRDHPPPRSPGRPKGSCALKWLEKSVVVERFKEEQAGLLNLLFSHLTIEELMYRVKFSKTLSLYQRCRLTALLAAMRRGDDRTISWLEDQYLPQVNQGSGNTIVFVKVPDNGRVRDMPEPRASMEIPIN